MTMLEEDPKTLHNPKDLLGEGERQNPTRSSENARDKTWKEDNRNSKEDRRALVEYKKAPSRRRRSRSRSRTPGRKRASPQKQRSRSRSQRPKWRRASSRRRRSRSRSPTPEEGGTRKHHKDEYERPDSDWEKNGAHKTKGREDRTMTAREVARKALGNIETSPFTRKLQEARLPSRVKHGTFVLYKTNTDLVAHVQHYQQAMFMHYGDDAIMCKMFPSNMGKVALS
ncbi:uncharacterized protein LOC131330198 [Rhododendron vialii]|uniref:uncharacterized protein LOC131330198 n=1 Tax=Rhododendron vialii TaxID=182163 RepID=UPI00265E87F7|nr:uncharacterized protein LOC131330198 [Rhododendron vialii]